MIDYCTSIRQLLIGRITGLVPFGAQAGYRLNPAGNSVCGKADTKLPRRISGSFRWARDISQ